MTQEYISRPSGNCNATTRALTCCILHIVLCIYSNDGYMTTVLTGINCKARGSRFQRTPQSCSWQGGQQLQC